MTGPVDSTQDQPFNQETWTHQFLLLKSLHCGRPVLHLDRNEFIQCVTANLSGCDVGMTVYLRGRQGGIDSSEIHIPKPKEQD